MGPLDGPNFGAAFTYLIGSGPNFGSARRTQNWVRRSCCFGDDVCKCEVAAARGVNCVDAPRVVCWCTEKVFGVLSYILDCHEFTLCPITVEAPHLRLCFRYGFATPVLGPRFPLSCALARAWCSRLSVLLLHRCCAHWVHVWQQ